MTHEEQIVAFVDDQLAPDAHAAFAARVVDDTALTQRVMEHRWLVRQIVAACDEPDTFANAGLTPDLAARMDFSEDNVVDLAALQRPKRWWLAGAMAACLGLGIVIGQGALAPAPMFNAAGFGRLVAGAPLASDLSNRLQGDAGPTRITMTFRSDHGICRAFETGKGISGLACKSGGVWELPVVGMMGAGTGSPTEYRLAAGETPASVMAEIDRRITGEPLRAAEEAKLKANGWR